MPKKVLRLSPSLVVLLGVTVPGCDRSSPPAVASADLRTSSDGSVTDGGGLDMARRACVARLVDRYGTYQKGCSFDVFTDGFGSGIGGTVSQLMFETATHLSAGTYTAASFASGYEDINIPDDMTHYDSNVPSPDLVLTLEWIDWPGINGPGSARGTLDLSVPGVPASLGSVNIHYDF